MAGVPITPAQFKIRFVEFASVDDSLIQAIIDEAVLLLECVSNTSYYTTLQYYYVAHVLAIALEQQAGDSTSSGPVTSKSVGSVSVGFASASGGSNSQLVTYYNSTSYGQQFWAFYKKATVGTGLPYAVL
jgi:hypothetical protein